MFGKASLVLWFIASAALLPTANAQAVEVAAHSVSPASLCSQPFSRATERLAWQPPSNGTPDRLSGGGAR